LFLIAATEPSWIVWLLTVAFNILKVAIGLGMVIFVHELGHFLVAKLCGVKCEKFYLGFDIAGLKLAKFTWGETEYGIGILPLGGYVKMLGQEDNPARLREELERAKAQVADKETSAAEPASSNASDPPIDVQMAQQALYDPRSYLAKSVPKRMAIISAGVVMNALFAFVMAIAAYGIGVQQPAPVVGGVVPGAGAWQAGVEAGDRVLQIGDTPIRTFMDLKAAVSLGDYSKGVSILVERTGHEKPFWVVAEAETSGLTPTVGVGPPLNNVLADQLPVWPQTPAAEAKLPLEGGDRVVALDGTPVSSYADIHRYLAAHRDEPLKVTIQRLAPAQDDPPAGAAKSEELTAEVAPARMRHLGLVMRMGPIVAMQVDSPAKGQLQLGDLIQQVNGEPSGDPMTLPDRLRRLAQDHSSVQLSVLRKGQPNPLKLEVPLRPVDQYDSLIPPGDNPMAAPALGIAYQLESQVEGVLAGSPAAKAGLKPGDVVVQAKLLPPDAEWIKEHGLEKTFGLLLSEQPSVIDLTPGKDSWPYLMAWVQKMLPNTRIELTLKSGRSVTLEPVQAEDWFNPDRGFVFEVLTFEQQATSLGDAIRLGTREAVGSLTMVFRIVQRLLDNQVSPKALSGPLGIAQMAYYSAAEGTGELLVFLTLLSANLAVLNFLPIPVLDGGHMVFLAYEGITGKPPNERVQLALTYLGLLLLLSLMIWVVGLDTGLISRQ
jgi:regulator of sigma E protease